MVRHETCLVTDQSLVKCLQTYIVQ